MGSGDSTPVVPAGFKLSTAGAGIKYHGRDDMGFIYCPSGALCAGGFTRNRTRAAPVVDGQKKLRRPSLVKAVLVNSGCANACTGAAGMEDLKKLIGTVASALGLREREVLMCSTGVIGQRLPVQKMQKAIKELINTAGSAGPVEFARAIMTTDSFPKVASRQVTIGRVIGSVLGIAKGAGMISPSMATMLCFILTDLAVEPDTMRTLLRASVDETFNCITVDNDMSTNDTVLLMSSGGAGNRPVSAGFGKKTFQRALFEVMDSLARMIIRDGEGATKTMEVLVRGARNRTEARRAARAVAGSLLVKTALYGADPNWGRIMATVGASGAAIQQDRVSIKISGVQVVRAGISTGKESQARKAMTSTDHVLIEIDLALGRESARALGCDLTEEYVKLNAEYTT